MRFGALISIIPITGASWGRVRTPEEARMKTADGARNARAEFLDAALLVGVCAICIPLLSDSATALAGAALGALLGLARASPSRSPIESAFAGLWAGLIISGMVAFALSA